MSCFRAALPLSALLVPVSLSASAAPESRPEPDTPRYVASDVHDRYVRRAAPTRLPTGAATGVIFQDGFETGMSAWAVTDHAGAGVQWADADCWTSSGTRSASCAAGGVNAIVCGADYPADVKTWMVHGPFDLSDSTICDAELEFTVSADLEPGLDGLFAAVSTDGVHFAGVQWTDPVEGTFAINMEEQVGMPQVWIGFRFHSDGSVGLPDGARVDDVVVRRIPSPPTAPRYGITLSASATDPRVHTTETAGLLWLWYVCDTQGSGLSSVSLVLRQDPVVFPLSVLPLSGFSSQATSDGGVILTNDLCTTPPVPMAIVANIVNIPPWGICVDPCRDFYVESCETPAVRYGADFIGVSDRTPGNKPCQSDPFCGAPTPVENHSWGSIKAAYR